MGTLFQLSHIHFLADMFRTAIGGIEWFVAAYVLCIVFFFIIGRRYLSLSFVYPLAFMALTIFNPFLIVPVSEIIGLTVRIRRLFWLIPVNLVLAFAAVCLCTVPARKSYLTNPPASTHRQNFLNHTHRALALAVCITFIVVCGTSVRPYLNAPRNIYKADPEVIEISRLIEEDSEVTGLDKHALYSNVRLLELRQFDPSIKCFLRRSDLLDWNINPKRKKAIRKVIHSGHQPHILALVSRYGLQIKPKVFRASVKRCSINYIISEEGQNLGEYFTKNGFELIGTAGMFEVYRIAQ